MDIEKIKAREKAASPGPWEIHDGGRFGKFESFGPSVCQVTGEDLCQPLFELVGPAEADQCKYNFEFVAHARADIPALVERVEALTLALTLALPLIERAASLIEEGAEDLDYGDLTCNADELARDCREFLAARAAALGAEGESK